MRVEDWSAYIKSGREFYASRPPPPGRWRKRARAVIVEVIGSGPGPDSDTAELLRLVDAAYPFGPRSHAPYKAWLAERKLLITDLEPVPKSAEEWGAVLVAIDMLESDRRGSGDLGDGGLDLSPEREAEIRTLLNEQAPNRHSRPCPTCAARKGDPCREADHRVVVAEFGVIAHVERREEYVERLIPHAARCQP